MKRVLGLDLGTNSIGWALIEIDKENYVVNIIGIGSRIIPMDVDEKDYQQGKALTSKASQRTTDRGIRKNNERFILRRDRINVVLEILKSLPDHYTVNIDFDKRGQFKKNTEPKVAYYLDENGDNQFYFMDSYREMEKDFKKTQSDLFYAKPIKNNLGEVIGRKPTKIPFDWTLYYLRQKALNEKISLEELAWVVLSYNQKRGYEAVRGTDEEGLSDVEVVVKEVLLVKKIYEKDKTFYKVTLGDENQDEKTNFFTYNEETLEQVTFQGDLKEIEIRHKVDENGNTENTEYSIKEIQNRTVRDIRKEKNSKPILVFDSGITKEDTRKDIDKLLGQSFDVIIETIYLQNGEQKSGSNSQKIKLPKEDDWGLKKLKTETELNSFIHSIKNKNVGVSSYIYERLLKDPNFKIKGGEITVIRRDKYRSELKQILKTQREFHKNILANEKLFEKAVWALYPNNKSHRENALKTNIESFITDDTIFYQRDLKSKKSEIKGCKYETRKFLIKDESGNKKLKTHEIKVVPVSNPYFQESRIWQLIKNLKVYKFQHQEGDNIELNRDVTRDVLITLGKSKKGGVTDREAYQKGVNKVFDNLFSRKTINEEQFLRLLNLDEKEYFWNRSSRNRENEFKASKETFPTNETRAQFASKLKRVKIDKEQFPWDSFLNIENTYAIWHLVYSVKKKEQFKNGLQTLFKRLLLKEGLDEAWLIPIVNQFEGIASYPAEYGHYSEKALKKMLPLLRTEDRQTEKDKIFIENYTDRILSIKSKWESIQWDKEKVTDIVEKAKFSKGCLTAFHKNRYNYDLVPSYLNLDQICYLLYNKHSEVGEVYYWNKVADIQNFLSNEFKQHSLNNPVVENILVETMHLVCAIWKRYGNPDEPFFNKIHLELARDLKNSQKAREKISTGNKKQKATNKRIRLLLTELKNSIADQEINEDKFKQREKLKLYEEGALDAIRFDKPNSDYQYASNKKDKEGNYKISKKAVYAISNKEEPTRNELIKYTLWMEQRYISPYTGKPIKLSDIFNREKYEIEHVLPKKRINLDAMYNKVLCETEVNKKKGERTAYEFIKGFRDEIYCNAHKEKIETLKPEAYKALVQDNFNGTKRDILLSEKIPGKFTNAQFVNTAYIGKVAMKWLSNIVRQPEDDDYFKSKNLLSVNGRVTSDLRQDWLLNDAWGDVVNSRFKRLNAITDSNLFGEERNINGHKVFVGKVPKEIDPDFSKKRIDHRHHALDALVVALTTQQHIQYINNYNAGSKKNHIHQKLKEKLTVKTKQNGRVFKPAFDWWDSKPQFCYQGEIVEQNPKVKNLTIKALEDIIVSFKKKNKVVTQATNKIDKWELVDGQIKKVKVKQSDIRREKGNKKNWSVRKKIHKDTLYGQSKLIDYTEVLPINIALQNICLIVNGKLKKKINDFKSQGLNDLHIEKELQDNGISKIEIFKLYVKSRFKGEIDTTFNEKRFESITDISIRRILKNHLNQEKYQNQFDDTNKAIKPEELAFSAQGIKEMNDNIEGLNNGKKHKPIYKISSFEIEGEKFNVGELIHKRKRYAETADGANVYCGIYQKENEYGNRKAETPKIKDSIQSIINAEEFPLEKTMIVNQKIYDLRFILEPNDLVYLPTEEEIEIIKQSGNAQFLLSRITQVSTNKKRIFRFNNATKSTLRFTPFTASSPIIQLTNANLKNIKQHSQDNGIKNLSIKNEFGGIGDISTITRETVDNRLSNNDDLQIKDYCLKLEVDKLGMVKNLLF